MKIVIIGASGTIGRKVTSHFMEQHEVLTAGRNSGDLRVDISDAESLKGLFAETGFLDAVICIAGEAKWAPLQELREADYYIGIRSKLMGQVNLVRIGDSFLNPGGSITLSTGILADDPVPATSSAAMVNGALHSFVKAASLEMTPGHRLNAVSLGLVEDAYEAYGDYFPGHTPVSMEKVVAAYERSVLGKGQGEIIRRYW
jgi:NAD(P)-dependent dehydrogenase (short-subunit alcohol dehydrogenase family)